MKKFDAKRFELSHFFNTLLLYKDYVSAQIVHAWGNNLYHSFYWSHLILWMHNVDTLNICMQKFDAGKILFDKMITFWTYPLFYTLFLNKGFVNSAQIVHADGNQLVPELLLKPSDTLHIQCWNTEHLYEDIWCHKVLFWQNYIDLYHSFHWNKPIFCIHNIVLIVVFFIDHYCAGGI